MSKRKDEVRPTDPSTTSRKRTTLWLLVTVAVISLLTIGVFAKNGWFPNANSRTGWFGKSLAKNASNNEFRPK